MGSTVSAARSGVSEVKQHFTDRGQTRNCLIKQVDHSSSLEDGTYSKPAHLQPNSAKVDVEIKGGTRASTLSSNTGYQLNPHLHFAIRE